MVIAYNIFFNFPAMKTKKRMISSTMNFSITLYTIMKEKNLVYVMVFTRHVYICFHILKEIKWFN